jgi:formate/nitrite transporter FocA (FNT family)
VGKVFALWWPIAAFVTIGLEHSIANIFLIPAGIALGAKVTVTDFLMKNLLPVTIGNTIAGVLCVAVVAAVGLKERFALLIQLLVIETIYHIDALSHLDRSLL